MDGIAATIVGVLLVTYHYGCVICETTAVCQCEFPKHTSRSEDLEKLIAPLCGKRFTAEDNDPDGYTFSIGICTSGVVAASKDMEKAGVIQTAKKESDHRSFNIGGFDRTEIMAGNNWILLEYEGGGNYHSSCGQENKRTNIMITCNPRETVGTMRWIEENHNKSADCYYLFELEHNVACTAQPLGKKTLSTGSVICIFAVCVAAVYLFAGILFMRLCRRAKGMQQIPNYSFWRDFGALQADGCDLVCRCGSRPFDSKGSYRGIGDHQIECAADTPEEYDDHLLPM